MISPRFPIHLTGADPLVRFDFFDFLNRNWHLPVEVTLAQDVPHRHAVNRPRAGRGKVRGPPSAPRGPVGRG
ncbi:hypothetical protein ALMP_12160 [Streptomyces sp. A012304]|nr:hypothetical protein ALMP_12160 [Streptomyces sp. A012304]